MKARAWVWNGTSLPQLASLDLPELGPHDVLIKVRAVGVCATDLHIMNGGLKFAAPPYALGHEGAGEVIRIGTQVSRVKAGDACALDPAVGCNICDACLAGEKQHCAGSREYGINQSGFWQEYVVMPENNLFVLPEHVGCAEASQCETLHVCLGGVEKLQLVPGERVAILGDGPVGLLFAALCKLQGASQVTMAGMNPFRLQMALAYGATDVVNIQTEQLVAKGRVHRYDAVIEAVGLPQTVKQAQQLAANQGRILLFGLPEHPVEVDIFDAILREIRMIGSTNAPRVWPRVVRLMGTKQVDMTPFITHRFPFEQLDQAIQFASATEAERVKIVVVNEG